MATTSLNVEEERSHAWTCRRNQTTYTTRVIGPSLTLRDCHNVDSEPAVEHAGKLPSNVTLSLQQNHVTLSTASILTC